MAGKKVRPLEQPSCNVRRNCLKCERLTASCAAGVLSESLTDEVVPWSDCPATSWHQREATGVNAGL